MSCACVFLSLIFVLTHDYSVTRSTALQRFLYGNAGFDKLSAVEGLSDEPYRFDVRYPPGR